MTQQADILRCRNCGNTGLSWLSGYCGCTYGRALQAAVTKERQGATVETSAGAQFTARAGSVAVIANSVKLLDDLNKALEDKGSELRSLSHVQDVLAQVAANLSACIQELHTSDPDQVPGRVMRAATFHDLSATLYETASGPDVCVIEYTPRFRHTSDIGETPSEAEQVQRLVIRANDLDAFLHMLTMLHDLGSY